MENFLPFFKLQLKLLFKVDKGNKQNLLLWILMPILGVILAGSMSLSLFLMGMSLRMEGSADIGYRFFSLILTAAMLLNITLSIGFILSRVFGGQDMQLLLTLPIRPSGILLARVCSIVIFNLLIVAFLFTPIFLFYGIGLGANAVYYLLIPLNLLYVTFIPLVVATLIAIPIKLLMNLVSKNNTVMLVAILIAAVLGVGAYIFFMARMYNFGNAEVDVEEILEIGPMLLPTIEKLERYFPINNFLINAIRDTSTLPLNLFITIAIIAVSLVLLYLLGTVGYKNAVRHSIEATKGGVFKGEVGYNQTGVFKSLLKKEFRDMYRNPMYAFYCLFGAIMIPTFVYIFSLQMGFTLNAAEIGIPKFPIFIGTVMMFTGMNYSACATFTKDGKQFYLNKIIPVPFTTILKVRLLYASIINTVGLVLACVVGIVASLITLPQAFLSLGFFILANVALSAVGIRLDLSYPKLKWNTLYEGMKNSPASLLSLLTSFIFMIVGIIIVAVLTALNAPVIMWIVLYGLAIAFCVIAVYILLTTYNSALQKLEL